MQLRPKMFIASSSGDHDLLRKLLVKLEEFVDPVLWTEAPDKLGRNIIDWADRMANMCHFGLFILTPDARWGGQVNGNVLLELGLFAARHGLDRSFIVTSDRTSMPPDLCGILTAQYNAAQFEKNPEKALEPVVKQIQSELPRRRMLSDEILGTWLEIKEAERKEGRLSLIHFYLDCGQLKLKGRSFRNGGIQLLEWPHELNNCWMPAGRDEVFHTFDAEYGQGLHKALGVTRFRFEKDRRNGDGYFVTYGAGNVQEGQINFSLRRITRELLAECRIRRNFDFDSKSDCEGLVRTLVKSKLA